MNEDAKHIDLVDLTVKKLTGEASSIELSNLNALLENNAVAQKEYENIVLTWEGVEKARGISKEETNEEWERMLRAMDVSPQKRSTSPLLRYAAVAALLIISSLSAYLFIQNQGTTQVLANQVQTESLVDGSVITLNASSQLSYGKDFNDASREVNLMGEAFFDIQSNKSKPFIVHTQGLDITVVGTSFNVLANDEDTKIEVVVTSGTVQLSQGQKSILLEVGEIGTLVKKSGKLFKSTNTNINFDSWRTKNITFEATPLSEVLLLLNTVYDKSLYIENEQLRVCPITVSFQNSSFESIMKVIQATLNISKKKTKKGILVYGDGC